MTDFLDRLGAEIDSVARRRDWPEYDSARYLLETPLLVERTRRYIEPDEFDWDGLFAAMRPWSHGERLLVQAAWSLWRGAYDDPALDADEPAGPHGARLGELVWTLDENNLERVLQAIRIRSRLEHPT